jgi:proteasome lid subunit RPN8/RPN11
VLEEIRLAAVDAFFSLPRGGAEIGGILFGTNEGDEVRILASRPMECEHARGPTFVLSDKDRDRLRTQLAESGLDSGLHGLKVVGWYHSHTRSEIFLSELDLEIYREFFPEPWQVALVVRPAGLKPTRAGFFFRDRDGLIRNTASLHEFILVSPAQNGEDKPHVVTNGAPAISLLKPLVVEQPAPAGTPGPEATPQSVGEAKPKGEADPLPPSTVRLRRETLPVERASEGTPEIGPPFEMVRPVEFVPPAFMRQPEPRSHSRTWMLLAVFLLVAAGTAAYFTSDYWMTALASKPAYLHLKVFDTDGQLRIEWDRESLAPQDVQGGTLEIVDGVSMTSIPLDGAKVRMGSFQYARRSEMVEIHLAVRTPRGPIEEFTSFIGQAPPPPRPTPNPEQAQDAEAKAAEAERARGDLRKQELRTLELERSLDQMRQQMRREDERRRVENQMPATEKPQPTETRPAEKPPGVPVQAAANKNSSPAAVSAPTASLERPAPPPVAPPPPKPVATAPTTLQPAPGSLSGRWVYSSASKSGSPFPPESVTLVMSEAYQQVRGVFVGRYRVPKNRKFNPKVNLNFEGPVRAGGSKFSYTSPDGMKGELELIRLPGKQDAIEVVWTSERDKLTFDDIFFRVP